MKRAWLLEDPKTSLSTTSTSTGIEISIPQNAPDPLVSVIAVEIDGELKPLKAPENISKGIRPEVSSFWHGREEQLDAKFITDGDPNSMWAAEEKARSASITIDLGAEKEIAEILISDAPYGRTQEFDLEAKNASGWQKIASGTSIGNSLRLQGNGIKTTSLRLNLHKTSDTPTLAEFQVFANSAE